MATFVLAVIGVSSRARHTESAPLRVRHTEHATIGSRGHVRAGGDRSVGVRRGRLDHISWEGPSHQPGLPPISIRSVDFEGFPAEIAGNVTPHKALKLIARGKLTFDERVVLHRVVESCNNLILGVYILEGPFSSARFPKIAHRNMQTNYFTYPDAILWMFACPDAILWIDFVSR